MATRSDLLQALMSGQSQPMGMSMGETDSSSEDECGFTETEIGDLIDDVSPELRGAFVTDLQALLDKYGLTSEEQC